VVKARRRAWSGWKPSPLVAGILVALVASFVLFTASPLGGFARAHLALVPARLWHQPWTLLSSALLHASLGALISSALGLWFFGGPLGDALGARKAAVVLIVATIAGSLASGLLGLKLQPNAVLTGAAPATMAAIAGFGAVYGNAPVRLFGVSQLKASTCAIAFLILSGVLYLMSGDLLGLAGAAAGAAVGAASTLEIDIAFLRQPLAKLRRWRIRRRYRVLPGGRDTRRFQN